MSRSPCKASRRILIRLRVQKRIENLSVLDYVLAQSSFQLEAGFFQNSRRGGIAHVGRSGHSPEGKFFETIIHERRNNLAHDALAPEFFTEPVAKFRQ